MASQAGRGATVSIDDEGNTPRVISTHVNSCEISMDLETGDNTSFGDVFRAHLLTLRQFGISIEGQYDTTADTGSDDVFGVLATDTSWATLTTSISPDGGTVTYAGESILTNYTPSMPVDGIVSYTAELLSSGAWTRS